MKNHYICAYKNDSIAMKRLFVVMLVALSALLLCVSCGQKPLPERLKAFVDTVEQKADSFARDDWDAANEKFEAFCKEYQDEKGSLTMDQIKDVRSSMGRYMSIALRCGADSISDTVKELGEQIPGLVQEISDAVPGLVETIGNFIRDLASGLSPDTEEAPAE